MTQTTEIAEQLVALQDWLDLPFEQWPRHEFGTPLTYAPLAHYPAVTPENASAALGLLRRYFAASYRRANRAWARLPPDARREIAAEVRLLRFERAVDQLRGAVDEFARAVERCSS